MNNRLKILIVVFTTLLFCSCNRTENGEIELELLTKQINCAIVEPINYIKYVRGDSVAIEESRTTLEYKIKNNSSKTYYFNITPPEPENKYIKVDRAFLSLIDENDKYSTVKVREPSRDVAPGSVLLDYLNYNRNYQNSDRNFIIHPGETLYFEWFVTLPFGNFIEDATYSVILDKDKKHFAELVISSDTAIYKNKIPRNDMKTIKDNGYEIFTGILRSKNKVPVTFNHVKKKLFKSSFDPTYIQHQSRGLIILLHKF